MCGGLPQACVAANALVGTLPIGRACATGLQCASGHCSSTAVACGNCVEATPIGAACASGSVGCARGSACIGENQSNFKCLVVATAEAGSSCDGDAVACGSGLFCSAARVCAKLAPLGQACDYDLSCERPGVVACRDGICVAAGQSATGAPCESFGNDCMAGSLCDRRTLKCRPIADAVSECTYGDRCPAGSHCEVPKGASYHSCLPDLKLGEPCGGGGASCEEKSRCDYEETKVRTARVYPADCK